jgi:hypothetical protein
MTSMTTVQISDEVFAAARREAERRGVDVNAVVTEAVRRFVIGRDMRRLLDECRRQDAQRPDALTEDEAAAIAAEETRRRAVLRRSGPHHADEPAGPHAPSIVGLAHRIVTLYRRCEHRPHGRGQH